MEERVGDQSMELREGGEKVKWRQDVVDIEFQTRRGGDLVRKLKDNRWGHFWETGSIFRRWCVWRK